jgi:polyhydroxybutyrate depolymerase
MSNRLGCSLSDKIAAIAPVAGSMPKLMSDKINAPRAMPVMTFHGTDDRIVKPNGADFFSKTELSLSATELAAWWAKSNGCSAKPVTEAMPDTADDGTRVTRHSYRNAQNETLVIHYEITGGGHTWPGGAFQPEILLGKTTKDINASELMWEFFHKHALPAKPQRDTK